MKEEKSEMKTEREPEITNSENNSVQSIETIVLEYCKNIFTKEKNDEFISNLTEEQKRFLNVFVLGFQSALGHQIVGIYDYDYINQFKLNQNILNSVHIILRSINIEDLNIKFVIVAQTF